MSTQRIVLLDKNFIQKRRMDRRLGRIVACGCSIVLSDNVVYELCSDRDAGRWAEAQQKLFDFAGNLVFWRHTAELLRSERDTGKPATPIDEGATEQLRQWFKSRQVYVPQDRESLVAEASQQREGDTYGELAKHARNIGRLWPDFVCELRRRWIASEDVSPLCRSFLNVRDRINQYVRNEHGDSADQETYISGAELGLDESWFTFHHARSILALTCVFLGKYGFDNQASKSFPNTMLDANYLALLNYADGIATDETTGDLASMLDWLYGGRRKLISSGHVDERLPSDDQIRLDAFDIWEKSGQTHGHHVVDWVAAEKRLCEGKWDSL